MKNLCSFFLLLLLLPLLSTAQCEDVNISVSASDTSYAQLYHAGIFFLEEGQANVCQWEITSLDEALIHEETTAGDFDEQSFMLFEHDLTVNDSMQVVLTITNELTGNTCTITDTLIWVETEVLPDMFIGNWGMLGNYTGVEGEIVSTFTFQDDTQIFSVYPSIVTERLTIESDATSFGFDIIDNKGAAVDSGTSLNKRTVYDANDLPAGNYFIRFHDGNGNALGVRRIIKR